jgi:pyrroline-5-carboxylate reductase
MENRLKITFIGGGNMGAAMVAAVIGKKLALARDIVVSDVSKERRSFLVGEYGVLVTESNINAVQQGSVIVLAVKPQQLPTVLSDLKGKLVPAQLLLSIAAGVKMDTLMRGLGHDYIVRAMPNTPAQIGAGLTVWTATPVVAPGQKMLAAAILGTMGREIYVNDENYVNMATAVSGSGPAYVFLFMEALIAAAAELGLPRDMAREMVFQTLAGAVEYARQSGTDLAELRSRVTSPGGTTAAALAQFEQGHFNDIVKEAVSAAYRRAQELGG